MSSRGLVVVRGAGDLGSGVAVRLWRCGFAICLLEREKPLAVRRTVAFSEAVYDGTAKVEDVTAVLVSSPKDVQAICDVGRIPLLVDPQMGSLESLRSVKALLDATLAKQNLGMTRELAPITIGLGPGFIAGRDVDAVIETNRGPDLGRVIWSGSAEANTGKPAPVDGYANERVLRAPADGRLDVIRDIGSIVSVGEPIASVRGIAVKATFPGQVRGLLRSGTEVHIGQKIGDVDPRLDPQLTQKVSDKALAVAGGVLEAAMALQLARRREDARQRR